MLKTKRTSLVNLLTLGPVFFILSITYLILAMHLPVTILTIAPHDDALFWRNAFQIVSGNWLGYYNQMTLAKGTGFPLFLAANAVAGTPVTLMIALLYLFACGLIVKTLSDLGLNKYLVLTIFTAILFHPELFPTRIIRDNIYPALSLIIISGAIRMVCVPLKPDRHLVSVVPYGLFLGLFWVTREEGIWIVPGLLFLLFLKVLQLKKQNLPVKNVFYKFACFLSIAIIFVSFIALINYHKYGKFEVVDFKSKAFSHVLKSLNSVDAGQELPYLPVSFNKRQEIYKISPTFSQLKNYFEDKGKGWTSQGCAIYPWTCGDYAGGWFIWALRDAAASKGYYRNPIVASAFYNNITKEIEKSCDLGLIKCKTNPVPFMPNITMTQLKELPGRIFNALKLAMVQFPVPLTGGPSLEPLDQLQGVRLFLGSPLTTLAPNEQRDENGTLYFDQTLHIKDYSRQDLFLKIKDSLASIYKIIIPVLVLSGVFAYFIYLISTCIGKAPITDIFIVSTMLWGLFFSRILLIVFVDISSFPAINSLYMSAAFPILCLAAILSLQLPFLNLFRSTKASL